MRNKNVLKHWQIARRVEQARERHVRVYARPPRSL